jgi:SEC-C motif-containing protein
MQNCPCGTGKTYADCCGPFLSQQKNPSTPEELMRSRFTAYSSADDAYIAATMKAPASNRSDPATVRERMDKITWTRLEVLHASQQGKKGSVEFRAYYVSDDQQNVLHEISEFRQDDGK